MRCAGCGVEVERGINGHWGHREGRLLVFVCRSVTEEDAEGNPGLVAADYHYVQGEEQRHWPAAS